MSAKRVICLYRVSTKKQVDKNDIPMQKIACHQFIEEHPDWSLIHEYYEKGVSGFKKSANDRDVLQEIKANALANKFDILLVFMFDRLGRREDETPFVVEWFSKHGIEIWSTKEGQQKFDNHIDKLMNYIRFWQADGESEKTSIRVDTRHTQIAEEGLFRGGIAPFGYKLVLSDKFNKKKKQLYKLTIDDKQAQLIQQIYSYVKDYGYGNSRIAQTLNMLAIPSPHNTLWRAGEIGYILRNPIYKGYPAYKKSTRKNNQSGNLPTNKWILSKQQQNDLVIIPSNEWDTVQCIRQSKLSTTNARLPLCGKTTKSPLLFVGIIYCGYCGSRLFTSYIVKYNKNRTKKYRRPQYRCPTKTNAPQLCQGQTMYSGKKIDNIVLDSVYNHLKQIVLNNQSQTQDNFQHKLQKAHNHITTIKNKIIIIQQEKNKLLQEISKCLIGQSKFTEDMLSKSIDMKDNELKEQQNTLVNLQTQLENIKLHQNDNGQIQHIISSWNTEFCKLDIDKQKMYLRKIIKRITVYKDKINIEFYETENEFLNIK